MPLTLIKGHYRVVGARPDGDSVKFYPLNGKADWRVIRSGRAVKSNMSGGAQLRLDGIDALETHYAPRGGELGTTHQPLELARSAATELLSWLGFRHVRRDTGQSVTHAEQDQISGYILTRFADKYGRSVAFAFRGERAGETGDQVRFLVDELRKSANYHLLLRGYAYPTYYSKLYPDIRRDMTDAVNVARNGEHPRIWQQDKTMTGFEVGSSFAEIQDTAYLLPKLYRRLVEWIAFNNGDTSLDGFADWLDEHDDRVVILPEGHHTGFDQAIRIDGQSVKLITPIENLVFQEK